MTQDNTPPSLVVVADEAVAMPWLEALRSGGFTVRTLSHADALTAALQQVAALLVHVRAAHAEADYALCRSLHQQAQRPHRLVLALEDKASETATSAPVLGVSDVLPTTVSGPQLLRRLRYGLEQQERLERLEAQLHQVAGAQRLAGMACWQVDLGSQALTWFAGSAKALGFAEGDTPETLEEWLCYVLPSDRGQVLHAFQEVQGRRQLGARMLNDRGEVRFVQLQLERKTIAGSACVLAAATDVSDLRQAERHAARLAYFDHVTGFPNGALLGRSLAHSVQVAREQGACVAVLSVEIDSIARVRDTLGHLAADELALQVANRVCEGLHSVTGVRGLIDVHAAQCAGEMQTMVARRGAEGFSLVVAPVQRLEDAEAVAEAVIRRVGASYRINDGQAFVGCNVGIAAFPQHGDDVDVLLQRADAALRRIKSRGRNLWEIFSDEVQAIALRRLELENRMRMALSCANIAPTAGRPSIAVAGAAAGREFQLYYQPRVCIPGHHAVGCEALLRWQSPGLGFVSPAEFIPVAEETGLIVPLGEWVLRRAAEQSARWQGRLAQPLAVAVNVSARQFHDAAFPGMVERVLRETAVAPQMLEIEITEGMLMKDVEASIAILEQLHAMGLRLVLDDFGTGYSSLSYLTRFPVDVLKIDRSFVWGLGNANKSETITAAIIGLARNLGISVVGEGVETEQQLAFLEREGCHEIQGYYFGKPMPPAELEAWLAERYQSEQRQSRNSSLSLT
ncbi:MAG: putative bifunctional diguanylate cyclase/phosphodiesterase [Polyangiales bacterium]